MMSRFCQVLFSQLFIVRTMGDGHSTEGIVLEVRTKMLSSLELFGSDRMIHYK